MLTEPSTHYYRNMTEQEAVMPALIGQVEVRNFVLMDGASF
jgi:hypothetical protein